MTAHYFATKTKKFVIISQTNLPQGTKIEVGGKVEAKKVAKQHGAKPWNF